MNIQIVKAFGTEAQAEDLKQLNIERREVTAKDVTIDILYWNYQASLDRNPWGQILWIFH